MFVGSSRQGEEAKHCCAVSCQYYFHVRNGFRVKEQPRYDRFELVMGYVDTDIQNASSIDTENAKKMYIRKLK